MKMINRYVVTPLFSAITGCATQSALDIVRNDVDAVKTRLFSVEKDLGGVRRNPRKAWDRSSRILRPMSPRSVKFPPTSRPLMDSNKTEMQAMNGKIDDIAIAIKKPTEDLARYREDADRRIIALEDRIIKLQIAVDELNNKFARVTAPQAKEQVPSPPTPFT